MQPAALAFLNLGAPEILLVGLLLLLFFGADKLPQMARSIGRAKAELEKTQRSVSEALKNEEEKALDEQLAFERERERQVADSVRLEEEARQRDDRS